MRHQSLESSVHWSIHQGLFIYKPWYPPLVPVTSTLSNNAIFCLYYPSVPSSFFLDCKTVNKSEIAILDSNYDPEVHTVATSYSSMVFKCRSDTSWAYRMECRHWFDRFSVVKLQSCFYKLLFFVCLPVSTMISFLVFIYKFFVKVCSIKNKIKSFERSFSNRFSCINGRQNRAKDKRPIGGKQSKEKVLERREEERDSYSLSYVICT